ncbi:MAG: RING finger protein [Planctomycetaceae bacterium]
MNSRETSPSIITCTCGAKVRLPDQAEQRSLRCPKCKNGIALTSNSLVLSLTPIAAGENAICIICQTETQPGEECVVCPDCKQIHHRECWSEVGGCGTYGCKQAPSADNKDGGKPQTQGHWGDTKVCPACGETIKSIALRCRFCKTDFNSANPLTVKDLRKQAVTGEKLEKLKKEIVVLFALSFTGCFCPILLIVYLVQLMPIREDIEKCGPLIHILFWAGLGISAFMSIMIALFIAYEFVS